MITATDADDHCPELNAVWSAGLAHGHQVVIGSPPAASVDPRHLPVFRVGCTAQEPLG